MTRKRPIDLSNGASASARKPDPPPSADAGLFPVVGVGASAGGLDAFTQLLHHVPTNTGMAFVLIQHLSTQHDSILAELLDKATGMSVKEATDGAAIEPNCVYVIPPTADLAIAEGELKFVPRTTSPVAHMPIDLFFRTLAQAKGAQAIGIVLSGTGSDGALGIQDLHDNGGIVMVQSPESAGFDSMPRSAISTGCADFVLPLERIAGELARIGGHAYVRSGPIPLEGKIGTPAEDTTIRKILNYLKIKTGADFSSYKPGTIYRRTQRRMLSHRIDSMEGYLEYLMLNPAEAENLYNDILIKVTSFFRDPETFDALKNQVFAQILKDKPADAQIRIWVPGCSTGEEVYSLAICLLEYLGDNRSNSPIQIFGSDISDEALDKARAGSYIENIAQDVSPERLERFFTKVNGRYQVNKSIRDICVFAKQNILRDPPFSRLDLISCRNLLIYLSLELQRKVMPLFHFSLNPNGLLLLGSSESVGSSLDIFSLVDNKHKLYGKKPAPPRMAIEFPSGSPVREIRPVLVAGTESRSGPARSNLRKETDRTLLSRYAPSGVIVDRHLNVLHFIGDTSAYLQNAAGEANLGLLSMVREGLQVELSGAVQKAKMVHEVFVGERCQVEYNGRMRFVRPEIIPITLPMSDEIYWAVMFKEETAVASLEAETEDVAGPTHAENRDRWKRELIATKTYLEAIIEEKAAAFEELQSANEEILSSNEELQSINEEAQTAKEELQSSNEELTTVNDELQQANQVGSQLVSDLNNLLDSVSIPIVIVDRTLKIRRFTSRAGSVLRLIPADIGRPLSDVNMHLNISDLKSFVASVIDSGTPRSEQVKSEDGHWFSVRVRPSLSFDRKIDGAIIVLIDVDDLKHTEEELLVARDSAEDTLATIREPLVVLSADMLIQRASPSFYRMFGGSPETTEGRPFFEVHEHQWDIPALRSRLEQVVSQQRPFQDFEVDQEFKSLGRKVMLLNSSSIKLTHQGPDRVLLAIEDITERKRSERELIRKNMDLEDFSHVVSHDLQAPLRHVMSYAGLLSKEIGSGLSGKGRDYIDRIQATTSKMTDLIKTLLDYARATASSAQAFVNIDMGQVVREVLLGLEIEIAESGATVTVGDLPTVSGNLSQINQLITNLIDNAIKYRGEAAPEIRISARQEGPDWIFSVSDNGVGVDAPHAKRIFDLFQRTRTTDKPGSGIGLTICRKVLDNHRGRIWVESALGKGSTFFFSLPVHPGPPKE